MHGVIARIAPDARVIDVGHGIPRQNVLAGALALRRALPYTPAGVHLAVVDPEVGARRRAVALRTIEEGRFLVGPDNGLLLAAAERFGGVAEAVEVSHSRWRLEPVSATFHGRDLFAPVAARLARGEPLAEAGAPLEADELVPLRRTPPDRSAGALEATVVAVDAFGNLMLDAGRQDLPGLKIGRELRVAGQPARGARTFADVERGRLLVYEDAGGHLAIAINAGDAAAQLGVAPGDRIRIEPA